MVVARARRAASSSRLAGLGRATVEGEPEVEVGWSVSPPHQRRGIASEAATASIRWGFDVCGLERIVAFTLPENAASLATMESVGMSYERDFDHNGLRHRLYSISRGATRPGSSTA